MPKTQCPVPIAHCPNAQSPNAQCHVTIAQCTCPVYDADVDDDGDDVDVGSTDNDEEGIRHWVMEIG